jgi:hypothetical protein
MLPGFLHKTALFPAPRTFGKPRLPQGNRAFSARVCSRATGSQAVLNQMGIITLPSGDGWRHFGTGMDEWESFGHVRASVWFASFLIFRDNVSGCASPVLPQQALEILKPSKRCPPR